MTKDIKDRLDWKNIYDKINVIVNKHLDPLGVADSIDDEYSGLVFKIYSTLLETKDKTHLANTIKKTIQDYYETSIPDNIISSAVEKIVEIKFD